MIRRYLPKNTEELLLWYERYISPLALVGGFLCDNLFLLRRVDVWESNALLMSYLVVAAIGMLFLNAAQSGKVRGTWVDAVVPYVPIVVQFEFGGLFSGFLSLYSRSAGFLRTWVFVAALALLLLGNERFRRLYQKLSFQIPLYFFVLFSFCIFFLPVVFRTIGPSTFIISGLVSLALIAVLFLLAAWAAPRQARESAVAVLWSVVFIYGTVNLLYFTNMIPPLPLALKDAGIYHDVTRESDGSYQLSGESSPWYDWFLLYNDTFHAAPGDTAVVFTSVFAPVGLTTPITHEWQRYDEDSGTWVTLQRVTFPINGGRDGGYRGYSVRSNLDTGQWRVNVLTAYGATIGEETFTVVAATTTPALTITTK